MYINKMSQETYICLDFYQADRSQSFLRSSSWVIILKFGSNKFSISFLDWLLNFSLTGPIPLIRVILVGGAGRKTYSGIFVVI